MLGGEGNALRVPVGYNANRGLQAKSIPDSLTQIVLLVRSLPGNPLL